MTPLRVAVTAARLAAGHAITPTVTLVKSSNQNRAGHSEMRAEYTGLAQSSAGNTVGWYVGIDDQVVTVLTLEAQTDNAVLLNEMTARLKKRQ